MLDVVKHCCGAIGGVLYWYHLRIALSAISCPENGKQQNKEREKDHGQNHEMREKRYSGGIIWRKDMVGALFETGMSDLERLI